MFCVAVQVCWLQMSKDLAKEFTQGLTQPECAVCVQLCGGQG